MRRKKNISKRKDEQGVIITLVAIFMLGVVGAMAALSIDVVTIYTARSEAQLAADAAALAGARVLANSGMTSSSTVTLGDNAVPLAIAVATQVAASSLVGGRNLIPGASPCVAGQEICVNIPTGGADFIPNPQVSVKVQRTDLPTFFARIWGSKQVTVAASATAEVYNPSKLAGTTPLPVETSCVKPWLLPNTSPAAGGLIFAANGGIADATLLGWQTPAGGAGNPKLRADCGAGTCAAGPSPIVWRYYPGTTDPTTGDFPAPPASSCNGCAGFSSFQLSIAGCEQKPVKCNQTVTIDTVTANQDTETGVAVNTLIHSTSNGGDSVDSLVSTPPTGNAPFEFLAGTENPVVLSGAETSGTATMVSDSLVTVPVIETTPWPPTTTVFPAVQIIGFVQLFLSPTGIPVPGSGRIHTQVINLVGCGTPATGGATGQPTLGNGASPVAVRLITPP
jgi:Flp pilus assembly protein TadG